MNEKEPPRMAKDHACFRSLPESHWIPMGDGTLKVCRMCCPQARLIILTHSANPNARPEIRTA
jgi:hypothetical protein